MVTTVDVQPAGSDSTRTVNESLASPVFVTGMRSARVAPRATLNSGSVLASASTPGPRTSKYAEMLSPCP